MLPLIKLLDRADPAQIGMDASTVLVAEPDARAKATHVTNLQGNGLLAVLEHEGGLHVSFVVLSFLAGPSADGVIPALYEPVFTGEGASGNLRELRHTNWGEDGYLPGPRASLITDAFRQLGRWFDVG